MDSLASRCAWAIKTIATDKDLDKGITDVNLAKILGTDKNTLSRYRKERGSLMGKVIENLVHHYHFDPMWLYFNAGEPFPGARAKYKDVCGPDPSVGHAYIKDAAAPYLTASRGLLDPTSTPAREFSIDEDLILAASVLKSRTHYATALHLNIRSFVAGVSTETTISKRQDDLHAQGELIAQMQTRLDDLDRQNKKLREEMKELKKTSGDSPPIALETDHAARTGTEDPGT